MRTATILHNVLMRYDNLETDYTMTERFWNADPDLLDRYAVTDGKNHDVPAIFNAPTTRATVLTHKKISIWVCRVYGRRSHCVDVKTPNHSNNFLNGVGVCGLLSCHSGSLLEASSTTGD